jgi:hypothetical protein
MRGGDTLAPGRVYSVVSRRLPVQPNWLRNRDPLRITIDPALRARYTALPEIPTRVRDLARSLAATAPTTYDLIQSMTRWIATHTKYSLNPPRLRQGEDAVEQFLFEDQRGFCEQIAASLVVMLRTVGVPARLTLGYLPGKRNPFSGLYEVRASDAHAYTEVLFPGLGWHSFDPTADVPLAGEIGAFPQFAGAGLTTWVSERMPRPAVLYGTVAVVVALVGGTCLFVVMRRRSRRTWLETQLAILQRRAGVPIEPTMTLPRWLAGLPTDQRTALAPIVDALENEAWAGAPLDEADRTLVERRLTGVR